MAEVLAQFHIPVTGEDGRDYIARICGREMEGRRWEGWIEFDPQDGSPVLRTARETRQPNRVDLDYWVGGLTLTFLEGALERARHPRSPELRRQPVPARPAYDRPAPASSQDESAGPSQRTRPSAVLDPYHVFTQGEDVLREELGALSEGHLRNIVRAYDLVGEDELDLQALHRAALVEMIVAAVRKRSG